MNQRKCLVISYRYYRAVIAQLCPSDALCYNYDNCVYILGF